jgi:hypothetical protein
MAFLPSDDDYRFYTFDYSWVGDCDPKALNKIDGIKSFSQGLLSLQQQIRFRVRANIQYRLWMTEMIGAQFPWVSDLEDGK